MLKVMFPPTFKTRNSWCFDLLTQFMFVFFIQIVVPPLPGKALKRQLPFRGDEGLFEEAFIEERRVGLEQFINRSASSASSKLQKYYSVKVHYY